MTEFEIKITRLSNKVYLNFELRANPEVIKSENAGYKISNYIDKTLVCCRTAWDDFEKIVNNLGGAMELKRTAELKNMVRVYPDDYGGEDDYPRKNLKVRGHVRLRSKIIFNFGHRIKALTVSANEGFVRAAMQQGITYASYIHESRALTEGKEPTATKIAL